MTDTPLVLGVSDFVAILNQTLEFAYPSVIIVGELANLRVSKNRWVYFDLKDEQASVKFFGTVYSLPGPLEDGMMLEVKGVPRLHPQFGFSINISNIKPVGEGTIKRAAALLEAKLKAEGLFAAERKRLLPYPSQKIGLITSGESAAYADFVKIIKKRWCALEIVLADVQVQGEAAPGQLVSAIDYFNQESSPAEVLVITRGGGSAEDLAAFSTEQVTRAVAASRIPTLVAVGHETDVSLAELAADKRASTPSNAAELLVPDKKDVKTQISQYRRTLGNQLSALIDGDLSDLLKSVTHLNLAIGRKFDYCDQLLDTRLKLLGSLSPQAAMKRGYAILRSGGAAVASAEKLKKADQVEIELLDAFVDSTVSKIRLK